MLTSTKRAVLELIYAMKQPTTEQLHRYALPTVSRRTLERALEELRRHGFIDAHRLYPERGAASPRYFHLLRAGAHALGRAEVPSDHYRLKRREFFLAHSARAELALLARSHGWRLLEREDEARQALTHFLHALTASSAATAASPAHLLSGLVPERVQPDVVLLVRREPIVVIIGHPHAGRAFWRQRLTRYARIIAVVRAIAIPLSESQEHDVRHVVEETEVSGRYLILPVARVSELTQRLS